MAQGNILLGGAGASAAGSKGPDQSVERRSGARAVRSSSARSRRRSGRASSSISSSNETDFANAQAVAAARSIALGPAPPCCSTGGWVQVRGAGGGQRSRHVPRGSRRPRRVSCRSRPAKIIINARTGSVVMNQSVTLHASAVAHGNLSVTISADNTVSQPNPLAQGQTVGVTNASIQVKSDKGRTGQPAVEREAHRRGEGVERDRRDAAGPAVDPAGIEGGRRVARRPRGDLRWA